MRSVLRTMGSLMALVIGLMACVFAPATAIRSSTPSAAGAAPLTPLPTPTGLLPTSPAPPYIPPPGGTEGGPPPWLVEGATADWVRAYIRLATNLLNATGGDPNAFLAQVRAWAPTPTPYPTLTATPAFPRPTATPTLVPPTATASPSPTWTPPGPPSTLAVAGASPTLTPISLPTPAPSPTSPFPPTPTASPGPTPTPVPQQHPASAWVHIADLDDDGAPEWLISLPRLERQCSSERCTTFFRCEVGLCPGLVLLFEREGASFTPVHVFASGPWSWEIEHPRVLAMEDLNGDGETELVLESASCGLSCLTHLLVGRWDGRRWHDLAADPIQQINSQVTLVDRDGDGTREIVMYGGVGSTLGAGLQRKHTLVYAWREGRYRLVQDIPDPDPHIYFRMLDANTALAAENLDRALDLAMDVVTQSAAELHREAFVDERAQVRIVSYAAIEGMLVHALRHEPAAIEALLREIETNYDRLENPYVEASRRLWQTYRDTRDPLAACEAMERAVRERRDQAEFFRWYGYNMERLPLERVCPLDEEPGRQKEKVDHRGTSIKKN